LVKLVCMTQVYNQNSLVGWDGKTNILRFMESVTKYCDGLVAFDDGSTDGSRDIITDWSGDFELEIPSNKVNTPSREGFHRARGLEHCRRLGADFVLCLDPDEVFEDKAVRGSLRALCENMFETDGIKFSRRDLWRTDRYIRLDNGWSGGTGVRLFKLHDDVEYNADAGVRSPIAPDGLKKVSESILRIIHFGYSTDADILLKYKRFKALGVDLMAHMDDSSVRLCDADPKWLNTTLSGPHIKVYNEQIRGILS